MWSCHPQFHGAHGSRGAGCTVLGAGDGLLMGDVVCVQADRDGGGGQCPPESGPVASWGKLGACERAASHQTQPKQTQKSYKDKDLMETQKGQHQSLE